VLGGADPYDPPDGARWQAFGPAAKR
jgi:hypothetical protein